MMPLLSEVIELAEERMYHILYKFSRFQVLESSIRACYMCLVRLSCADSVSKKAIDILEVNILVDVVAYTPPLASRHRR